MTDKCEEFIFDFQKQKYCQRVITILLGTSDAAEAAKLGVEVSQPLCTNATNNLTHKMDYFRDAWQRGMMSNGEYLLYLNFVAHRSFNDPT